MARAPPKEQVALPLAWQGEIWSSYVELALSQGLLGASDAFHLPFCWKPPAADLGGRESQGICGGGSKTSSNDGQISYVCVIAAETDIMFANPVDQVGVGRPLALFILRERTKHLQEEVANRRFLAGARAAVKGWTDDQQHAAAFYRKHHEKAVGFNCPPPRPRQNCVWTPCGEEAADTPVLLWLLRKTQGSTSRNLNWLEDFFVAGGVVLS